jgi:hypothetical protein
MNSSSDWNLNHKKMRSIMERLSNQWEKNKEISLSNQPTLYTDYHNDQNDKNDHGKSLTHIVTAPQHLSVKDTKPATYVQPLWMHIEIDQMHLLQSIAVNKEVIRSQLNTLQLRMRVSCALGIVSLQDLQINGWLKSNSPPISSSIAFKGEIYPICTKMKEYGQAEAICVDMVAVKKDATIHNEKAVIIQHKWQHKCERTYERQRNL